MIRRFTKINDNLYRGGKPSVKDVIDLRNKYNIQKIISLDEKCGNEIKDICKKNDVLYLDTFGLLDINDFKDGLHPNAAGHEKIFLKVKNFLETNKWI